MAEWQAGVAGCHRRPTLILRFAEEAPQSPPPLEKCSSGVFDSQRLSAIAVCWAREGANARPARILQYRGPVCPPRIVR